MRRHETECRYSLGLSLVLLLLIADTRLASLVEIARTGEMPPASHWSRGGGSTDVTLTAPGRVRHPNSSVPVHNVK